MHYYIDGYNVLFYCLRGEVNLQTARKQILLDINKKVAKMRLDVTVVFDATYQVGEATRQHYDAIEIVFTDFGQTADAYIIEAIKHSPNPRKETVVTSDRELARFARTLLAKTEGTEAFMQRIHLTFQKKLRAKPEKKQAIQLPLQPKNKAKEPPPSATPESCLDYYTRVFETKWEEIKEQEKKVEKRSLEKRKCPPRCPKKKRDPFAADPPKQEKTKNEFERWLQAFDHGME